MWWVTGLVCNAVIAIAYLLIACGIVRPLIEKASLAICINEAWAMLAAVAVIGLVLVVFARESKL